MQDRPTLTMYIEAASVALLTGALNLLFRDQPGFSGLYYIPYLLAGLLFSTIYGSMVGLASLVFSSIVVAGAIPLIYQLFFKEIGLDGYWSDLLRQAAIPVPVGLAVAYSFGVIRTEAKVTEKKLKKRVEKLTKQNWLLKQKSESLFKVNLELDERVSKQTDSITSLYTQFQKLDILDLNMALNVFLETVQIFTGATRCSVWKYDEHTDRLVLAARRGWEDVESAETSIALEDTIEGWVYRNNSLFSARMTLQYDNLAAMDLKRNLITLPLLMQRKNWGLVNISEMPFEKYSLYTERMLHIIVTLAEHSIGEAVFYESIIRQDEKDEHTGLPLFSQFYRMLEEETRRTGVRKGDFSVIIVDFTNYGEVVRGSSVEAGKDLMRKVADELTLLSEHRAHVFHYKEESQIAVLYPNLDSDGVSLFCLEALGVIDQDDWQVNEKPVDLEAVIGFSVFSGVGQSSEEVLEQAENLLEMQKV